MKTLSLLKRALICSAIFITQSLEANALEIIYPKQADSTTTSNSIFFIGNATPGSTLTINGNIVKVWDDGSFVQVVPINDGCNSFSIKTNLNETTEEKTYNITKVKPQISQQEIAEYQPFPEGEYLMATIIKNEMPLRNAPNDDGTRLTHLSKGTNLLLEGKKGNYYKVNLGTEEEIWVSEKSITTSCPVKERVLASFCNTDFSTDKDFNYMKIDTNLPVAYKVKENVNTLDITIYGVKSTGNLAQKINSQNEFPTLRITGFTNNNLTISIPSNNKLWGYNCYYEGNQLIFKKHKPPEINPNCPLKGITIALDAGHGGWEYGSVGPTGAKEKDINLDIVQRLYSELTNQGANVVLIRPTDTNVNLYDRITRAKASNALLCISIHANALPDSGNPYTKHGTSTYYYYPQAKDFAETIKSSMINTLGTKDDGLNRSSLVMTRITSPVSILIEVAYMIHPEEYQLLLDPDFRQKAAISLKKGIETYLINETTK